MPALLGCLEPEDSEGADKAKDCARLKLPLPDDVAFFREKDQGKQSGEDDRCARENGICAGPHVKEGQHLGDLVNDVWDTGHEANGDGMYIDPRSAATGTVHDERHDGDAGDRVAIKVLCPGVVIGDQIELKERRKRPNRDRSEDGRVASRAIVMPG